MIGPEVEINKYFFSPKDIEVVDNITYAILDGKIKIGQRVPSITELSNSIKLL